MEETEDADLEADISDLNDIVVHSFIHSQTKDFREYEVLNDFIFSITFEKNKEKLSFSLQSSIYQN